MPYMNITEVESAIAALASTYPSICELITLPNATIEGRTTHAIRVGKQPANAVDIFYLTGGVHAREWGSCEILVNLATDLCEKYTANAGIGYGGKVFSAAQVKAMVEQMSFLIFPCVNPDGRDFSQNSTALWRKNRNPASSGGDALKIGVDINRNHDFLWNFNTHFHPNAIDQFLASTDPSKDTFHGTSPTSEPETKNIKWLHDNYPKIKWYIDVHSYAEDILYVWGDDESQVTTPSENFTNPAFDGQRGLPGDAYGEYIPDSDESVLISLAAAFRDSLYEVRQKVYVAKPGFSLYPTCGTNDCYAYSRHIADPSKSKAYSFTIEWGTEFQPPWTEMEEIIKDVCAGVMGFGLKGLGIGSFIVTDRDTFSSYELESASHYAASFYVMYDGFSPNALGVPGAKPTAVFRDSINGAVINSITATSSGVSMENPGAPDTAQRITFTFDVDFANDTAFTAETRHIILEVTFAGMQDIAAIHLLKQPNPYMSDGPVSWLSTDVRVFQLKPTEKLAGSNVAMDNPDSNVNAPYQYIQALVNEMRGFGNNPAPPFENISTDQGTSQLELSRKVAGKRVLNFAVAKVRYRANTVDAIDVRVFFRMFNTMVSDLGYSVSSGYVRNYRRTNAGTMALLGTNSLWSGAGSQIISIPYFSEKRVDTASQSMTVQNDALNKKTIVHAVGKEAYMYFGCWLDFNQTDPQFPAVYPDPGSDGPFSNRIPIMQMVRGIHQCLVAEIRYQPGATDPISVGATPAQSDRLAQRNLAIVESDNPGGPSTHVVQHTLLVKASNVNREPKVYGSAAAVPRQQYDELVIRWKSLPRDTKATIYFPQWNVDEVLQVAATSHQNPLPLTKVDAHTIECKVSDITYIPVPGTTETAYAGLLTLELPQTVITGQQFQIDVQQHSGLVTERAVHAENFSGASYATANNPMRVTYSARKVLGAFTLTIAVKNGEDMLPRAVRNLAALRYIQQAIPLNDQWHPVFERYIGQLAEKVRGLGVDPDLVEASPDDPGVPGVHLPGKGNCYTGKICEVFFDCFGDFEGFTLHTCSDKHSFRTREKSIGELALRASKERLRVTVCVDEESGKITKIIVHC